ncbi:MAG: hypothetical protein H0U50_04570 [Pyrinomonadaceae bacterium]|nr:hypothetical protein [Pyrinomonadaceae bacterium]
MKLKSIVLLSLVFIISINVFGQKTETGKPVDAKPAATAKLPTVKEILDKYVAALGGRAANEKIKTRTMKGTVELAPMGIKGTVEGFAAAPDKNYTKMNLQGIGEIIEGYDGKTSWTINPLQGNRDKTGEELLQTKLVNNFHREINLDKLYPKIEVKAAEKLGEKDVYVIVATPEGLAPETFYFDKQTGLLLRADGVIVSPEGKMPYQSFYEDVREVDGVKIPFKVRAVTPQFEFITIITEVKNGAAIDDAKFAKPKE